MGGAGGIVQRLRLRQGGDGGHDLRGRHAEAAGGHGGGVAQRLVDAVDAAQATAHRARHGAAPRGKPRLGPRGKPDLQVDAGPGGHGFDRKHLFRVAIPSVRAKP